MEDNNNESLENEYERLTLPEFLQAAFLLCVDYLRMKFFKTLESLKKLFLGGVMSKQIDINFLIASAIAALALGLSLYYAVEGQPFWAAWELAVFIWVLRGLRDER